MDRLLVVLLALSCQHPLVAQTILEIVVSVIRKACRAFGSPPNKEVGEFLKAVEICSDL